MWPDIEFIDDRDGCLFTARVQRKLTFDVREQPAAEYDSSVKKFGNKPVQKIREKSSVKTRQALLQMLERNPELTIPELADELNLTTRAIEKQLALLKKKGELERVGSRRKGYWRPVKPGRNQ